MKTIPPSSVNDAPEQGTRVQSEMRKRWLIILPAVFVTYSLAYVDRANYGFGAAAGLAQTLHISNSRSALLGALFFFGYFLFQVPGAAYARRSSTRNLIFFALITWGILASLTGVIRNFWLLALDRTLLGVAESFIFPAMLILLTNWFTRAERSRTNTLLLLGNPVTVLWMSAATGYLIRSFGWQMAFVLEGLPSVLVGAWLVLSCARPAAGGSLDEPGGERGAESTARARAVASSAGRRFQSGSAQPQRHPALSSVFLLERRRLRICSLVADDHSGGRVARHRDRGAAERDALFVLRSF